MSYIKTFKSTPLSERKKESEKVLKKYKNRIPIILDQRCGDESIGITKHKFLAPDDITMGKFIHYVREKFTKINNEEALIFFICKHDRDVLVPITKTLREVYKEHKCNDGYIYILVSCESVFG